MGTPPQERAQTPAASQDLPFFALSDDLPEGEILVTVELANGHVLHAIRRGEMTPELCARLNESVTHLVSTRWRPE
ncbi:hypothetical protein [Streptomyces sp. NPDC050560]|uniref:hypothetical protein n=1 Tax=Streptomyces sp. NPDC050560 TaxID=3365630 RepID=UPI0037A43AD7